MRIREVWLVVCMRVCGGLGNLVFHVWIHPALVCVLVYIYV